MEQIVRWGVIGAGGFADARAIPALKQCDRARLQGVMVRDEARATELAQKHGAPEAYTTAGDLLNSRNIDAVYVCTPVDYHEAHVLAAAGAGKHVLVEKPMAATVEECRAMIDACKKQGVQLGVAYMMRYRPQCRAARRFIDEGKLGRMVSGRAQNMFWYPDMENAWRQDPVRSRGGVLFDVGSHAVDTLRYLMGEVDAVQGLTGSVHFDYTVEDTALALLHFKSGALGTIDCSWAVPHRECPLELYGSQGSLIVRRGLGPFPNPLMRYLSDQGEEIIPLPEENAYTLEFEAVSQAILEGREPEVDGREGLRITEILLAIYRSAQRGEPVQLPPPA